MSSKDFTSGRRRRARRSRMLALLLVFASTVPAGFAALASAGVVTQHKRGTVTASGLTPAERRAIAVTSVTATGDPSLGLIVTVTFRGDVERYLGQGSLNHALAALVLLPKSPQQSGILDDGGGFARTTIPILDRHGDHLRIRRGSIDLFSAERVLSAIAPQDVAMIRDNNKLIFSIGRSAVGQAARLQLKLFATSPLQTRRRASIARAPSSSSWRKILAANPTELVSLNLDSHKLTCDQLDALNTQLSGVSARLNRELRREKQALVDLRAVIGNYPAVKQLTHTSPLAGKTELANDSIKVKAAIRRFKNEIANLAKLTARIGSARAGCGTARPATTATTSPAPPLPAATAKVVQTDGALSQYLAPQPDLTLSANRPEGIPLIDVNDQVHFQQFSGIGASMTDSSAWLIYDQLSASDRATLLKNLFGPDGIHLNFLRVPMAASDFTVSSQPYSYDDVPAGHSDPNLSQFSIAHDLPYIVPALKESLAVNPQLEILANPWSPPGWMKSNDSMDNINGQGTLLPSAYGPLANYFVKFIQAYQSEGVKVDAITPQNEPRSGGAGTSYPGLTLPEPDEANFISGYLQPALQGAGLHPKIYGNDLSWDQQSSYADPLATGSAGSDLAGIAWHCYFGLPSAMTQVHQDASGLDAIADECSPEIRNFHAAEYLISSLRNWASVVSVWNVALDSHGGPKEPANGCPGCTGVVTIDETSHQVSYSLEYYRLGQVSSFVQPGATRVDSPSFVTYTLNSSGILTVGAGLDDVAFRNPDGSKVLVANNTSSAPISFAVHSQEGYFTYTIPAQAMTTFVWP